MSTPEVHKRTSEEMASWRYDLEDAALAMPSLMTHLIPGTLWKEPTSKVCLLTSTHTHTTLKPWSLKMKVFSKQNSCFLNDCWTLQDELNAATATAWL